MGCGVSRPETDDAGDGGDEIAFVGLDGSGKTSLLFAARTGPTAASAPPPAPTASVARCPLSLNGRTFVAVDVPGHADASKGPAVARGAWRAAAARASRLVFVVDATDTVRLPLAALELARLLPTLQSRGVPVLVLANKQDVAGAASPDDIRRTIRLPNSGITDSSPGISDSGPGVTHAVVGCTARDPAAVVAALGWIASANAAKTAVVVSGAGAGGGSRV